MVRVKQINIDFHVTESIERFVYVYLVEINEGCILVDSGVAGSEKIIERAILEAGYTPSDLKAVLLTHAHPDHIGTAQYFREQYGVKIYASKGERAWIEDIDLQFKERPIPNFYHLAGQSTTIDQVVKAGDKINLSDDTSIEVIGTPGHSIDEVSYRVKEVVFTGDSVPVRGDIPIFIDVDAARASLDILEKLSDVDVFYPAWDKTYSREVMKEKLVSAKNLIDELEQIIWETDEGQELSVLTMQVCERLHMLAWKSNPLFARTVKCCRREEKGR